MRIGVLGLQGDVSEHIQAIEASLKKMKLKGSAEIVREKEELEGIDGLVIPGGESTAIARLLQEKKMFSEIKKLARNGLPVLGTCAGAVLLAKKGGIQVKKTGQKLLGLMDMKVERNSYGRQVDSFETKVSVPLIKGKEFNGIFIRAPKIRNVFGKAKAFAFDGKEIVGAEQGNLLALTFHPELGKDLRIHEFFLKKIKKVCKKQ